MDARAPPSRRLDETEQRTPSGTVDDRLRRLHHQLQPQRAIRETELLFKRSADFRRRSDVRGDLHFRDRDDEISRQLPAREREQRRDENIQRAHAPGAVVLVEWLHSNADERRQHPRRKTRRDLRRARRRVPILLGVLAIAVAVFKIQPEILRRFAAQLRHDALVNRHGEHPRPRHVERLVQRVRIRRVFIERTQRDRAELLRGIRLEKVRAAIDDMHRLPAVRLAGIPLHEGEIRAGEFGGDGIEIGGFQGRTQSGVRFTSL